MSPFFFHYEKLAQEMCLIYLGQQIVCKNIDCRVPCWTKWGGQQPYLVMEGVCNEVVVQDGTAVIS